VEREGWPVGGNQLCLESTKPNCPLSDWISRPQQVVPRRVKHIKAQRRPIALPVELLGSMNGMKSVSGSHR